MQRVLPECFVIKFGEIHLIIAYLAKAKRFFTEQGIKESDLILHLPPPLLGVLVQVTSGLTTEIHEATYGAESNIMGIRTVPGYENRIVMSLAEKGFYQNYPVITIDGLAIREKITYNVH
jgi:hypothetical protein